MTHGTVLIVGAGHAGFQVAASLRQHGYGERICLINDEAASAVSAAAIVQGLSEGEGPAGQPDVPAG